MRFVEDDGMLDLGKHRAEKRNLRVGMAPRLARHRERRSTRSHRGKLNVNNPAWRRCAMGTNHIACFGVWRTGTRRQGERINRAGATRWHMPHRIAAWLSTAMNDVVNQD